MPDAVIDGQTGSPGSERTEPLIAQLTGTVSQLGPTSAVVEVGGFGVLVLCASFRALQLQALTYVMEALMDFGRWPAQVFPPLLRALFTFVIPLLVMTSYPAEALLEQSRTVLAWLRTLPASDFARSTVLPEWDLRHVAGHLVVIHAGFLAALDRPSRSAPVPVHELVRRPAAIVKIEVVATRAQAVRWRDIEDAVCYPFAAQIFSGIPLRDLKRHVDDLRRRGERRNHLLFDVECGKLNFRSVSLPQLA